jgi:predicted transcriptional regulator
MPDFYDLMFEVSNEERVRILEAIKEERSSFSGLARKLEITTQEVSRHFNRLMKAGLTTRGRDGFPTLTPFGSLLIKQLKAVQFTNCHQSYFMSHVTEGVPVSFLSRLGELAGMQYQDDVMRVINNVIRIIKEAEEYILDINLPYIASAFPHIKNAYDRNVKGMFLHGPDLKIPNEMQHVRDESFTEEILDLIRKKEVYEEKSLAVDVVLYMNEKEVAILCFPTIHGDYDFRGFNSTDPNAHKWCKDMFYYFWEMGEPIR